MKAEITKIVVDTMMGVREGVGQCRNAEFRAYLEDLINAKEKGVDIATIPFPMLTDRVEQGVEAAFSIENSIGAEGGIEIAIFKASGSYGRKAQEAGRVKVDMVFLSTGAPDIERLQMMTVDELRSLLEVIEA